VTFRYKGHEHNALMTDLSESGAGFRTGRDIEDFFLARGEEIAYTVKTPYGSSQCRARTEWAGPASDGYAWGTVFTYLSDDPKDPLRSLLDSPF